MLYADIPVEIWARIGKWCMRPGLPLSCFGYHDIKYFKDYAKCERSVDMNTLDLGGLLYLMTLCGMHMEDVRTVRHICIKKYNNTVYTTFNDKGVKSLIDMCMLRKTPEAQKCCRLCFASHRKMVTHNDAMPKLWRAMLPPDDLCLCMACFMFIYRHRLARRDDVHCGKSYYVDLCPKPLTFLHNMVTLENCVRLLQNIITPSVFVYGEHARMEMLQHARFATCSVGGYAPYWLSFGMHYKNKEFVLICTILPPDGQLGIAYNTYVNYEALAHPTTPTIGWLQLM